MPKLQGLLFDLDGTLLDSAPDLRQGVNKLLADHDRRPLSLDEVKAMTGDGAMALVERAFAATGGPLEGDFFPYVQAFIQHYRNVPPDPAQIFPQGRETLELFSKAGVKLGICTNKPSLATTKILDALDLSRYFGCIAGGDTYPVHKPHPDHLLKTIETLGVSPEGCVFVGDGPNDVVAARAAGLPSVVMMHGYCDRVEELEADRMIAGFDQLPDVLRHMGFSWPAA
jgi:phosphoglycolate phosphatase